MVNQLLDRINSLNGHSIKKFKCVSDKFQFEFDFFDRNANGKCCKVGGKFCSIFKVELGLVRTAKSNRTNKLSKASVGP